MKKYLTYRTARLGGYIGLALLIGSVFTPEPWDALVALIGYLLAVIDLAATAHQNGYEKGQRDKLKVEIYRVWSEQEPFATKTFREGASK